MKKLASRILSLVVALVMLVSMAGVAEQNYAFETTVTTDINAMGDIAQIIVDVVNDNDGCYQFRVSGTENGRVAIPEIIVQLAENAIAFGTEEQMMEINQQSLIDFAQIAVPFIITNVLGITEDDVQTILALVNVVSAYMNNGFNADVAALQNALVAIVNDFAQTAMQSGLIVMDDEGNVTISVTCQQAVAFIADFLNVLSQDTDVLGAIASLNVWSVFGMEMPAEQLSAVLAMLAQQLAAVELPVEGQLTLDILTSGNISLYINGSDGYTSFTYSVNADAFGNVFVEENITDSDINVSCSCKVQQDGSILFSEVVTEDDETVSIEFAFNAAGFSITAFQSEDNEVVGYFSGTLNENGLVLNVADSYNSLTLNCSDAGLNGSLVSGDQIVMFNLIPSFTEAGLVLNGTVTVNGAAVLLLNAVITDTDITATLSGLVNAVLNINFAELSETFYAEVDGVAFEYTYNVDEADGVTTATVNEKAYSVEDGTELMNGSAMFMADEMYNFAYIMNASQMGQTMVAMNLSGELTVGESDVAYTVSGNINGEDIYASVSLSSASTETMNNYTIDFSYLLGQMAGQAYTLNIFNGSNEEENAVVGANLFASINGSNMLVASVISEIAMNIIDAPAHINGYVLTGEELFNVLMQLIG